MRLCQIVYPLEPLNISIHTPAKGATSAFTGLKVLFYISIHTPAKGATPFDQSLKTELKPFQSTHPRRVRRLLEKVKGLSISISIHTPAKGATIRLYSILYSLRISIHTPAKGATITLSYESGFTWISIHTPAKGATTERTSEAHKIFNFNPHTREGCDSHISALIILTSIISIHTPAKGATCGFCGHFCGHNFNPHTREGCDAMSLYFLGSHANFNPHTREGCDYVPHLIDALGDISIHTPAKGATL